VILKGNLHAHTTFSDGVRTPAQLVAAYEKRGYDFLAITDHDHYLNDEYWRALRVLKSRMVLFHGMEIDYRALSQHVGQVHGDREMLHVLNHPARYNLTLEETRRRIAIISADGFPLDAVEVTDTGHYRPEYDSDLVPLRKIATDDAHREAHFGRAWVEVEARRDRDAIIRAIKAGDFRLGFSSAQ
jgi:PHP domain